MDDDDDDEDDLFQLCGGGFSGIFTGIGDILLVNFHIRIQVNGPMQN